MVALKTGEETRSFSKKSIPLLFHFLFLRNRGDVVRAVDIACEMQVSKVGVSVAMKKLEKGGYIVKGKGHGIYLTPQGKELAKTIYERHLLFSDVLFALGVGRKTALYDACRLEYVISAESFQALKNYVLEKGVDPAASKE